MAKDNLNVFSHYIVVDDNYHIYSYGANLKESLFEAHEYAEGCVDTSDSDAMGMPQYTNSFDL